MFRQLFGLHGSMGLLVALALASCSGDDDASSPEEDAAQVLSDLDNEQRMETCESVVASFESGSTAQTQTQARLRCLEKVVPLSFDDDGLDVPACDALLERCVQGESFPDPDPNGVQVRVEFGRIECNASLLDWIGNCRATVGALRTCFEALGPVVARHYSTYTCGMLRTSTSPPTEQRDVEWPSECDELRATCRFED